MMDIEKIKEYTGGDEEFISTLFNKFLGRLDTDLDDLQAATNEQNWPAVRSKTHAMLSSARIFFLEEIVELSKKIESDCESSNAQEIPDSVRQLIVLYRRSGNEMRDWKLSA
jgi:HPt (histidine-containing phosphotransfer) domain-containing protein